MGLPRPPSPVIRKRREGHGNYPDVWARSLEARNGSGTAASDETLRTSLANMMAPFATATSETATRNNKVPMATTTIAQRTNSSRT